MWKPRSPLPRDFCGRPPCPLCFDWHGADSIQDGMQHLAMELLQKPMEDLTTNQLMQLDNISNQLHDNGMVACKPDNSSPPPPADIGMSSARRMNGWLKHRPKPVERPEDRLNCDQVVARQQEREALEAREQKERDERLSEVREVAKAFSESKEPAMRSRRSDPLDGVPEDFLNYCYRKDIRDPREIYDRWQSYRNPEYTVRRGRDPWGY